LRVLRRLREERAYSLVELVTVMAIMSIVMTGITTVFVQGSNAELDMNNRFQAQTSVRLALDKLRQDVHCSSAVTNPATLTAQGSPVSLITLTDPCGIRTKVATVGVLSGTGTGTFTISPTYGFPATSTTYQIDSEQVTGTLSGNTITISARGINKTTAVAHAANAPVISPVTSVSWCAVSASGDIGLYRRIGTTCTAASPAVRQIDRMTSTGVFWNQPSWFGGALALVYAKFSVNTATAAHLSASQDTYALCDGIVLRNSVRPASGSGNFLTAPTGCGA
jgi:prepilin-type N-terminal cleavage/methylation domain-containing protein